MTNRQPEYSKASLVAPIGKKVLLAIEAIVGLLFVKTIPQIRRRLDRGRSCIAVALPTRRILQVRDPLKERTGVTGGRVSVAEHADFAVDKKVVERHELARELMMNRRVRFAE